jgi:hypothetical protein
MALISISPNRFEIFISPNIFRMSIRVDRILISINLIDFRYLFLLIRLYSIHANMSWIFINIDTFRMSIRVDIS